MHLPFSPLGGHSTPCPWAGISCCPSLLLINLIQIINLIIFFVIRIKNALSISFAPGFVFMEFVIKQVIVLGLGDISFFAHGFSNQQKEKRTV